jgi:hypothetical protein
MIRWMVLLAFVGMSASFVNGEQARPADAAKPAPRFGFVDVSLDAKTSALAAYQFEFAAEGGHATVVGIEGGDPAAFKNPPYYDPAALGQHRAILAAFSTGKDLPKGRMRIARIHLMIEGKPPEFAVKLVAAADADGRAIPGAVISVAEGARP